MAITPTGSIYKSFTFDGEDSRDYGVYITGNAVFDAPQRDVEMIEIPGRNGAYALDNGRFSNIEVTYPAGLFTESEVDFANAISDLRNALCSRRGYCRLEDEYNPDEYRLAVYKSGLEVTPAQLKAGEFSITFDCKPQRFLKSGETAVSISDGDTLTNPTLFESSPLLLADGYGDIHLNSEEIKISDVPLGKVSFHPTYSITQSFSQSITTAMGWSFSEAYQLTNVSDVLNPGDSITITNPWYNLSISSMNYGTDFFFSAGTATRTGGTLQGNVTVAYRPSPTARPNEFRIKLSDINNTGYINFVYGTAATYNLMIGYGFEADDLSSGTVVSYTGTTIYRLSYDGADKVAISVDIHPDTTHVYIGTVDIGFMSISGNSTKGSLGHPLYFDLDIGEAYKYEGDAVVSVNNAVSFPAKLPTLKPGANTVSLDNTITDLKIVPRWWIV